MMTSIHTSRKNETRGRILFIILVLIPVIFAFVNDFSNLKIQLTVFIVVSILAIVINQIMSKTFRKNNPIINDDTAQELILDKTFSPAIVSRVITFTVSVLGATLLAFLLRNTEFLHPIMFFLLGYVYFTMIQFKRL